MTRRVDRYAPGEWVRVIAPPPGDTNRGRVGIVDRTYADAGDMIHVVRFGDGITTDYYVAELRSIRAGLSADPTTTEQDS